mgnify:CR=1 FL=1
MCYAAVQTPRRCRSLTHATRRSLEKTHTEKMEAMKEEAMGKLKELGNSVLGFMGMSMDDFKFNQDPATGSWNISTNPNK